MLLNLHVKNMALISEADVNFDNGLNIFTGETGAGKSLLLGSVNLALGAKLSTNVIRHGAENALVELTFSLDNEESALAIKEAGFDLFDNQVILTRKITGSKSVFRVNGETTTATVVKKLASHLLDIHGQHDHQSLLYNDKQLDILDEYGQEDIRNLKLETANKYKAYTELKNKLKEYDLEEDERLREIGFLEYEINEIETAEIKENEEDELEAKYRLMANSKDIAVSLNQVHNLTGYDNGAGDLIGRAVKEMSNVASLDDSLSDMLASLNDIESLLSDVNRSAASYLDDFTFSEAEFKECEDRLDTIHHIQSKYGKTSEDIFRYLENQQSRLDFLNNYAEEKKKLELEIEKQEKELLKEYDKLTKMRKSYSEKLTGEITSELKELNFNDVRFEIAFEKKGSYAKDGIDDIDFRIATNPGEPVLPLSKVASGGELSRIMLAIKTILAKNDKTETLIFDEIDTGISGRTAVKVAAKLRKISQNHQVLCITHLAQIAAASDVHFAIDKTVDKGETFTSIIKLNENQSEEELARLLGGFEITDTVRNNAREMKLMAKN